MNKHIPKYDLDYDWFAFDRCGNVGHFTSAGLGPLPNKCYDEQYCSNVYHHMRSLGMTGSFNKSKYCAMKYSGLAAIESWLEMSKRGLFCFDYVEDQKKYILMTMPTNALNKILIKLDLVVLNVDFFKSDGISNDIIVSAQQGDAPEPATNVDPASPSSQPPAR